MKNKKRLWKSTLAILCVTTLTLGSAFVSNLQKVEANDATSATPVVGTENLEFGKDSDTYLQLENTLASTPNGVEATVGLDEMPTSWTLYSAEQLGSKYSAEVTTATQGDVDQGLPEGTQYVTLAFADDKFGTATALLNTTFDISMPYQYEETDITLQVWVKNAGDEAIEWNAGIIELTSAGKADYEEINYTISPSNTITLTAGWNLVEIPVSGMTDFVKEGRGVFDLQSADFMRWYGMTSFNGQTLCFSDFKLVANDEAEQYEWTLLEGGSTENVQWNAAPVSSSDIVAGNSVVKVGETISADAMGNGMGYVSYPYQNITFTTYSNALSIDVSQYELKDLAIGMWIYTEATTVSFGGHLYLSNETLQDKASSAPTTNLDLSMYKYSVEMTGWNYIEIPLDDFSNNSFSLSEPIKTFAVWKVKGEELSDAIEAIKIGDVKLVVKGACKEQSDVGTLVNASDYDFTQSGATISEQVLCTTDYNLPEDAPEGFVSGMTYSQVTIPAYDSTDDTTNQMITLNPTIIAPEGILAYEKDDLAVEFYFYSSSDSISNLPKDCQIELRSNNSTSDNYELNWSTGKISVQKGWKKITLNLKDATDASTGKTDRSPFELANVSSFRWYITSGTARQTITEDWTIALTDLKLVAVDDAETTKATVAVSTPDVTAMEDNFMVFSNTSSTEASPYAFFVTKEGKPALLYGTTQFTLNKKLPVDSDVTMRVVRDDAGQFTFEETTDGTTWTTVGKSTTAVTTALSTPTTKHCIGADAAGGQLMYGSIKGLKVYSDTACTTAVGDWALDGSSKWVLNTMTDATTNQNDAVFCFDTTDTANYAPVVLQYTGASAGTAPNDARMNGYVFAGWFTDSACTAASALTEGTTDATAYAKYVDANVLTAQAQVSGNALGEMAEGETAQLRFVTTVDSEAYTKVGFKITNTENGTTFEPGGDKVYDVLYAVGATADNKGQELEYYPTHFSPVSISFKTYTVTGIEQEYFETGLVFEVTPYWITLDGTTVYGAVRDNMTVQAGIDAYNAQAGIDAYNAQ